MFARNIARAAALVFFSLAVFYAYCIVLIILFIRGEAGTYELALAGVRRQSHAGLGFYAWSAFEYLLFIYFLRWLIWGLWKTHNWAFWCSIPAASLIIWHRYNVIGSYYGRDDFFHYILLSCSIVALVLVLASAPAFFSRRAISPESTPDLR